MRISLYLLILSQCTKCHHCVFVTPFQASNGAGPQSSRSVKSNGKTKEGSSACQIMWSRQTLILYRISPDSFYCWPFICFPYLHEKSPYSMDKKRRLCALATCTAVKGQELSKTTISLQTIWRATLCCFYRTKSFVSCSQYFTLSDKFWRETQRAKLWYENKNILYIYFTQFHYKFKGQPACCLFAGSQSVGEFNPKNMVLLLKLQVYQRPEW